MNDQAEYMLIGSILKDNTILEELILTPEHFSDLTNQNIYRSMLNVKRKGYPIDGASLKDDLGETGFLFIGGNERLTELKDCVPSLKAFKSYETMVLNQWKLEQAKNIIKETMEDFNLKKLQELIDDLKRIDENGVQEEFDLKQQLADLYNMVTVETPKQRSGIPSGYKDIDNKTDGFQENDLIIIGARPSMGKTAFILNLAINAALKADAIPIIFSLEMTTQGLLKRMMSGVTEVNGLKLKNPYHYLNEKEKKEWIEKLGILERIAPHVYDKPNQTVAEMRAKVRKVKHKYPDRKVIVFIDYLTKIKGSRDFQNKHLEYTEISNDLKTMAKDYLCPVVCLAQLSRSVEQRENKRPMMSDLRESGSIEQDADVIMMLYRDEYYNETTKENRNILEVNVAKNRDGEVGMVKLEYKKDINKIENYYY
ncbi:replicative DNA helicase [Bacillus phage vB_BhaS-171]|uniref:DnaB-like replicative helicase n=1 Tax=Bacillus phage vB_BhaS-171 TaxID=1775140 RepID=UPI00074483F0|nr:DnaB-like replicative helicase [Bacillus phage vB_BhaS-171]ALY08109.1 replicative DNA helicase [Bacillus phage vB_BhaS-171]